MPSADRRGRAYQCRHCPWTGDLKGGLEHVCKHVEKSPFFCIPCQFKAASDTQIQAHEKTSTHERKASGIEDAVKYNQGIRLQEHLIKLSKEDSLRHWKSREGTRERQSLEKETPTKKEAKSKAKKKEDSAVERASEESSSRRQVENEEAGQESPPTSRASKGGRHPVPETATVEASPLVHQASSRVAEKSQLEEEPRKKEQMPESGNEEAAPCETGDLAVCDGPGDPTEPAAEAQNPRSSRGKDQSEKSESQPREPESVTARGDGNCVDLTAEAGTSGGGKREGGEETGKTHQYRKTTEKVEETSAPHGVVSLSKHSQEKPAGVEPIALGQKQRGDDNNLKRKDPKPSSSPKKGSKAVVKRPNLKITKRKSIDSRKVSVESWKTSSLSSPTSPSSSSSSSSSSGSSPQPASQHSPAEEYETAFSESRFVPDYEEPADSAAGARPSGTVNVTRIIHDLLERPSAVAAAVMSLAKAQIATNQQLDRVAAQLQALEPKREDPAQQAQMKTLLGNLNKELATINRNKAEDNRSTAALAGAVKELTGAVRVMSTDLHASMGALATNILALVNGQKEGVTITEAELDIRRMAGEFDVNWAQVQEDHLHALAARRPSPPHFHSPLDNQPPPVSAVRRTQELPTPVPAVRRTQELPIPVPAVRKTQVLPIPHPKTPTPSTSAATRKSSGREPESARKPVPSTSTGSGRSTDKAQKESHKRKSRSHSPETPARTKRGRSCSPTRSSSRGQGQRGSLYHRQESHRTPPRHVPRRPYRYGGHYKGLTRMSMEKALRYRKRWKRERLEAADLEVKLFQLNS